MANATLILGGRVSLAWRCPSEHCARCFAALCLFLRPKCEESRRGWVFAESAPRIQSRARSPIRAAIGPAGDDANRNMIGATAGVQCLCRQRCSAAATRFEACPFAFNLQRGLSILAPRNRFVHHAAAKQNRADRVLGIRRLAIARVDDSPILRD